MGRYNVSERNRLPKFNAGKNPFAQSAAKPATEQIAVVKPASTEAPAPVVAAQAVDSPFSIAPAGQTWRISETTATQPINRVKLAGMAALKRGNALGLALIAKAQSFGGKLLNRVKRVRHKEPRAVIPRFGKPAAVQGELSLDNVKVVRNDLEESDLEIVMAQTNTSAQVAPTVAPASPDRGPVPPALKKLTNRMLGVKLS